MQVHIMAASGPLANGAAVRKKAGIETINVDGRGLMGLTPYPQFARQHLNGVQVGDASDVFLIIGGRKSIIRELTDEALLFRPPPGKGLAVRVIRQTENVRTLGQRVILRIMLPETAINHGIAMGRDSTTDPATGNVIVKHSFKRAVAGAWKTATAFNETLERVSKKFTYLQIYGGSPEPGDHRFGVGTGAVSSRALATQLQQMQGWDG